MQLPRTEAVLPRVEWRASSPSTNAELRELVRGEGEAVPHGTVLATADQTAGRGRLGRGWVTPPDTALAVSVLIRDFGRAGLSASWLPLIAGSAVTASLQPLFGEGLRVGTKWPNDVHVRDEADAEAGRPGRKLCGILCEVLPDEAIVVGIGINLLMPDWELPTERASSLLAAGGEVGGATSLSDPDGAELADRVLAAVVTELLRLAALAAEDPGAVRARVLRHSLTLGAEVRVHLPGDELVDGRAAGLADDGSLLVDLPTGGQLTVSAADVEHLR
ncbi:MAG: biotin--[acetyl-CoA-carboxylase] ligase [Leucobacter sp.]